VSENAALAYLRKEGGQKILLGSTSKDDMSNAVEHFMIYGGDQSAIFYLLSEPLYKLSIPWI
jgi:hypothetical protein